MRTFNLPLPRPPLNVHAPPAIEHSQPIEVIEVEVYAQDVAAGTTTLRGTVTIYGVRITTDWFKMTDDIAARSDRLTGFLLHAATEAFLDRHRADLTAALDGRL